MFMFSDLKYNDAGDMEGYWSNGEEESLVIGHWAPNQPDSVGGSHICTKVLVDGTNYHPWSLEDCEGKLPFVCQIGACITGENQTN